MKKILLGIGSIGTMLAPVVATVACASPDKPNSGNGLPDDENKLFDIEFKKIENNPTLANLKKENYVRAEYSKAVKTDETNNAADKFEVIITNVKAPKFSDEQIQEINSLSQKATVDKSYGFDRSKLTSDEKIKWDYYPAALYKFKFEVGLQLISAIENNPTKNVSKIKFNGKYLGLKKVIDAKNADFENGTSSTKIPTNLLEYINAKLNDKDNDDNDKTEKESAKETMSIFKKRLKMSYTEKQGFQLFMLMDLLDKAMNNLNNDEKMQKVYNTITPPQE